MPPVFLRRQSRRFLNSKNTTQHGGAGVSRALLLLPLLLVGACAAPVQQPDSTTTVEPVEPPPMTSVTYSPGQFAAQFNAVEDSLADGDWLSGLSALSEIPEDLPAGTDRYRRQYLDARIKIVRGDSASALADTGKLLSQPLDTDLRSRTWTLKRYILRSTGRHLEAAQMQASTLATTADEAEAANVRAALWEDLQQVPKDKLAASSAAARGDWAGWLALALLDARSGDDVGALAAELSRWQAENPEHPAAASLPGGLAYLAQDPPPPRITLMLPLSGRLAPAGKAVRDGYLAHYFSAQLAGQVDYELDIIDLDREDSAAAAYTAAVEAGSELVIGPLSKSRLAEIGQLAPRSVPVLALNRLDTPVLQEGSAALVQMSLAPTDEARQLADLVVAGDHRRVLLLHASGRWGNAMANAFATRLGELGGTAAGSAAYTERSEYSATVEGSLNLPASNDRAQRVRRDLAQNLQFTPRRRQDLDAVVLLTRSVEEMRSLKPLLAFHYAGGLPVYTTSHAADAAPGARQGDDLNGLRLLEMPWVLDSPDSSQAALDADPAAQNYRRMHALGADAFRVQQRLDQLQAGPELVLRGHTGLLRLDPQLRITRQLEPAEIDRGALVATPLY